MKVHVIRKNHIEGEYDDQILAVTDDEDTANRFCETYNSPAFREFGWDAEYYSFELNQFPKLHSTKEREAFEFKAKEILAAPYTRVLVPDPPKDGQVLWSSRILELPGCVSCGNTAQEAAEGLEEAAMGWVICALEDGTEIPEPRGENIFLDKEKI